MEGDIPVAILAQRILPLPDLAVGMVGVSRGGPWYVGMWLRHLALSIPSA